MNDMIKDEQQVEEIQKLDEVEEQVEPTLIPESQTPKVKPPSKISKLKELLQNLEGWTKEELAELTGLKLSTVNCQIYFHLPNGGNKCERIKDTKKFRFVRLTDEEMDEVEEG